MRLRGTILRRDPWCVLCRERPSEEVDHIVPLREGGEPWKQSNLRGLCVTCHRARGRGLSISPSPPSGTCFAPDRVEPQFDPQFDPKIRRQDAQPSQAR